MSTMAESRKRVWTEAELQRLPEDGYLHQICHSPENRQLLGPAACLDGEHLLPGFRYPIANLFKEWEWD